VRAGGPAKAPIAVEADTLMRLGDHRSEVALRARQVPGQALDTFMTESIHRGVQYGISVLTSSRPALPAVAPCSTVLPSG